MRPVRAIVTFALAATAAVPAISAGPAAAAPMSLKVNFQPVGFATPAGYVGDSGEAYDGGRGYGRLTRWRKLRLPCRDRRPLPVSSASTSSAAHPFFATRSARPPPIPMPHAACSLCLARM